MDIKDELRDYTIALDNAARAIHKKSEYKDPVKGEEAIERKFMDIEVNTIKKISDELKVILEKEKGTYWDYLNDNEGECI